MKKVKIEAALLDRAKKAAEAAGYSSVEEFVTRAVEKELARLEAEETDEKVADRLRGLGYME